MTLKLEDIARAGNYAAALTNNCTARAGVRASTSEWNNINIRTRNFWMSWSKQFIKQIKIEASLRNEYEKYSKAD